MFDRTTSMFSTSDFDLRRKLQCNIDWIILKRSKKRREECIDLQSAIKAKNESKKHHISNDARFTDVTTQSRDQRCSPKNIHCYVRILCSKAKLYLLFVFYITLSAPHFIVWILSYEAENSKWTSNILFQTSLNSLPTFLVKTDELLCFSNRK